MSDGTTVSPADAGQATGTDTTATTQTVVKPWYDGADPDTIGYIQNKKWDAESPLKVVEGYRHLEKFHGVPADQIIKLPKSDDVDGWNGVYAKLGRPESPDKYGMDGVKLPEGATLDEQIVSRFDKVLHAKGASKDLRDTLVSEYAAFEEESRAEITKQVQQEQTIQVEALKKEWGPHYEERRTLAQRAMKSMFPDTAQRDSFMTAMEASIGPAAVAKAFANLAEKIGEDKIHDGSGDRAFGYTREQALNDLNTLKSELKANPERLAMYNKGLGTDVEKINKLNKILAGG